MSKENSVDKNAATPSSCPKKSKNIFKKHNPGAESDRAEESQKEVLNDNGTGTAAKDDKKDKAKYDECGNKIVKRTSSSLTAILKTIIYIVVIIIVSVILSYFVVTVANDIFAFQKADVSKEIVIDNYRTVDDIADILAENDIITYPSVFKLYASLKDDDGVFIAGRYTVDSTMNYDTLLALFKSQKNIRQIVTLTIPEGFTTDEIIDLFLSEGMGTREGFEKAIAEGDYSEFEFIKRLEKEELKEGRKYRLDGYLFPDTYEFYKDWDEERILYTLLDNFNDKFPADYYEKVDQLKLSVDEYITLASIIQSEAKYSYDLDIVSRVFHNRLNNPKTFPRLESDATIQYALDSHKTTVTPDDLKIDSPYNTYLYDGLPPGAICSPGADAIYAALQPSVDSEAMEYYYFVSRLNGEILYAKTKAEHNANIEEVKKTES